MDAFLLLLSLLLVALGDLLLTISWLHPEQGIRVRWTELVLAGTTLLLAGLLLAAAYDIGSMSAVF